MGKCNLTPVFVARFCGKVHSDPGQAVVAMTACSTGQSNNFHYKPIDFRIERAAGMNSAALA